MVFNLSITLIFEILLWINFITSINEVEVNGQLNLTFKNKAFLIGAYKKFKRKGIKFGIPCCKCYRKVFKKKRNVEKGDRNLP